MNSGVCFLVLTSGPVLNLTTWLSEVDVSPYPHYLRLLFFVDLTICPISSQKSLTRKGHSETSALASSLTLSSISTSISIWSSRSASAVVTR